jgi:4-alpha-glucanotransferase
MRADTRAQARRQGVLTRYQAYDGSEIRVDEDAVVAVLDALGPPPPPPVLDPVSVAWDADLPRLRVDGRVKPADLGRVDIELEQADGTRRTLPAADLTIDASREDALDLVLPAALSPGAHTATLVGGAVDGATATILAAPRRLPAPTQRRWGVFAPVYGLHDAAGAADLGALARLADWAAEAGAAVVGTLPLLATFLGEPCDPSPYSPVSRRWWNDLYVDLAAVPELAGEPIPAAVGDARLDHSATMAARRRALELGARRLHGDRERAVARFAAARPEVHEYARFRAAVERHGPDRDRWPDPQLLERAGPVDEAREAYHRYVQFLLDEQLRDLGGALRARGQSLYLDLPVGTHPGGFDVYQDPDGFARGATTGAPPDEFFGGGQNWGFRPPHPAGARAHGYRDLRLALARHFEVADIVRLDHAMGLHRLWWIPDGASAADGAYVRYPMEELFAVVCGEAARAGATVVGEDLGTVSRTVERALAQHRVRGMYVGQFAVDVDADPPLAAPSRRRVASLDTHDTATFAGYWTGTDVDRLEAIDAVDAEEAAAMRRARVEHRIALAALLLDRRDAQDPGTAPEVQHEILRAWLGRLAAGPAELVLVTLEDLWLELDPQNVPGTSGAEHHNWCRRLARATDALASDPDVAAALAPVQARRSTVPC